MVTNLTPGTVLPILDGSGCPIVNTEVPINEGPLPEPPVNIFVNENPLPPQVNSEYTGTTLKPSTYDIPDAIDKVIALAWEKDSDKDERLVFHFGMTEKEVKDKLYEKDIILEYYKEFEENGNKKTNSRNS
jgi:hypothetical protein